MCVRIASKYLSVHITLDVVDVSSAYVLLCCRLETFSSSVQIPEVRATISRGSTIPPTTSSNVFRYILLPVPNGIEFTMELAKSMPSGLFHVESVQLKSSWFERLACRLLAFLTCLSLFLVG